MILNLWFIRRLDLLLRGAKSQGYSVLRWVELHIGLLGHLFYLLGMTTCLLLMVLSNRLLRHLAFFDGLIFLFCQSLLGLCGSLGQPQLRVLRLKCSFLGFEVFNEPFTHLELLAEYMLQLVTLIEEFFAEVFR